MAACDRCGTRKLKKLKKGTFAGFFWCRMHGPVGPRPMIEAAILGIPLSLRNEMLRRQIAEGDGDREKIKAIEVEVVTAYHESRRRTDDRSHGDGVPATATG